MLFRNYTKEIFRPGCNPSFQSVHCIAHLAEDIREVLPYLNTILGGFSYTKEPPSVTFKVQGRLVTLYPRKIAINALKDEAEADKILEWLQREINAAWEKRAEIEPKYESAPKPEVFEMIDMLSTQDIINVINVFKKNGSSVLLITHREEIAMIADRGHRFCAGGR